MLSDFSLGLLTPHSIVFIARQHAVQAERDIMLAVLSVCPSVCLSVCLSHSDIVS